MVFALKDFAKTQLDQKANHFDLGGPLGVFPPVLARNLMNLVPKDDSGKLNEENRDLARDMCISISNRCLKSGDNWCRNAVCAATETLIKLGEPVDSQEVTQYIDYLITADGYKLSEDLVSLSIQTGAIRSNEGLREKIKQSRDVYIAEILIKAKENELAKIVLNNILKAYPLNTNPVTASFRIKVLDLLSQIPDQADNKSTIDEQIKQSMEALSPSNYKLLLENGQVKLAKELIQRKIEEGSGHYSDQMKANFFLALIDPSQKVGIVNKLKEEATNPRLDEDEIAIYLSLLGDTSLVNNEEVKNRIKAKVATSLKEAGRYYFGRAMESLVALWMADENDTKGFILSEFAKSNPSSAPDARSNLFLIACAIEELIREEKAGNTNALPKLLCQDL